MQIANHTYSRRSKYSQTIAATHDPAFKCFLFLICSSHFYDTVQDTAFGNYCDSALSIRVKFDIFTDVFAGMGTTQGKENYYVRRYIMQPSCMPTKSNFYCITARDTVYLRRYTGHSLFYFIQFELSALIYMDLIILNGARTSYNRHRIYLVILRTTSD